MSLRKWITSLTLFVALLAGVTMMPRESAALVRLENICTIEGQDEVKLTGIGLVVGLNGTGDGGDNMPAMRALAEVLKLMHTPADVAELKKSGDNVAMVLIEATVPKTGLRRGQKVDCYVSSTFGAKSLRGGRLLVAPVESAEVVDDSLMGVASGAIQIEDAGSPTSGKIPGGIVLDTAVVKQFINTDGQGNQFIRLLLDPAHSSFHAASDVARVVNAEFSFEAENNLLARAVDANLIEVVVPRSYRDSPVEFVAQMLDVRIDNPNTQAKVIVNAKSGVVIVTGEVEISPVIISHKNLTVEVGGQDPGANGSSRFVPISNQTGSQSGQQLKQLVDDLNQLRVPTEDIISIIRELHRSGKLHAEFDEH